VLYRVRKLELPAGRPVREESPVQGSTHPDRWAR
jgi:hypothetical protein